MYAYVYDQEDNEQNRQLEKLGLPTQDNDTNEHTEYITECFIETEQVDLMYLNVDKTAWLLTMRNGDTIKITEESVVSILEFRNDYER